MGDAADDAMEQEEFFEDARSVLRQVCPRSGKLCEWEPYDEAGTCAYKCLTCYQVCDPFQ